MTYALQWIYLLFPFLYQCEMWVRVRVRVSSSSLKIKKEWLEAKQSNNKSIHRYFVGLLVNRVYNV